MIETSPSKDKLRLKKSNSSSPVHDYECINDITPDDTSGKTKIIEKERSLKDIKEYWLSKDNSNKGTNDETNTYEPFYDAIDDSDLEDDTTLTKTEDQQEIDRLNYTKCREYEEMVQIFKPLIVKKVLLQHILPHLTFLDEIGNRFNSTSMTPEDAMGSLLDEVFASHDVQKWAQFISALESSGYSFVVQNIKGYKVIDSSYQEKYLNILKPQLQYMIEVKPILPHLIAKSTLTDEDRQEIEATEQNKGTIAAANILLDRVTRKHESWYTHLLNSFKEIGRQDIADFLDISEMMLPPTKQTALKMGLPKFGIKQATVLPMPYIGKQQNFSPVSTNPDSSLLSKPPKPPKPPKPSDHKDTQQHSVLVSTIPDTTLSKRLQLQEEENEYEQPDVKSMFVYKNPQTQDHDDEVPTTEEQVAPPLPPRVPVNADGQSSSIGTKQLEDRLKKLMFENVDLKKQREFLDQIKQFEASNLELSKEKLKCERQISSLQKQKEMLSKDSFTDDDAEENVGQDNEKLDSSDSDLDLK